MEKLVDAAGEGEGPAAVEDPAGDDNFEFGRGAMVGGGLGAEFVVPVRAELGPPDPLRSTAGVVRAERERGKVADAERGHAVLEIEFHEERGEMRRIGRRGRMGRRGAMGRATATGG